MSDRFVSAAGSYLSAGQLGAVQSAIRELCSALMPDFMTLVDVMAPHDFLLRSCLGHSDGQVRTRQQETLSPDTRHTSDLHHTELAPRCFCSHVYIFRSADVISCWSL